MVSRFSYPSFKQFNVDRRIKFTYILIVPLFIVLVASRFADDAPNMFATYALSAPVLWLARRVRRANRGAPPPTPPVPGPQ